MQIQQVFEHYPRQERSIGDFKFCPFCGSTLRPTKIGHIPLPACSSCGFVQFRNPAPTVSVLVVDGERILLGKRGGHPGKGMWALPSGYIEYEEDFLTTAIREASEETGLDVKVASIINVVSSFVTPRFHFLGIYVVAQVERGKLKAGDDMEAVKWFPLRGPFPEMGFEEDVHIIALYRSGFEGIPVEAGQARIAIRWRGRAGTPAA